jgi:hypothetical protein
LYNLRGSNRSPDIHRKCSVMVLLSSWLSIMSQPGTSQLADTFMLLLHETGSGLQLHSNPSSSPFAVRSTSAHTCLHAPCVAPEHETYRCINSTLSPLSRSWGLFVPDYLVPVLVGPMPGQRPNLVLEPGHACLVTTHLATNKRIRTSSRDPVLQSYRKTSFETCQVPRRPQD